VQRSVEVSAVVQLMLHVVSLLLMYGLRIELVSALSMH
jgi:hypothetical protein